MADRPPRFATVDGSPDWVMLGVPCRTGGYLVFGSTTLTQAELNATLEAGRQTNFEGGYFKDADRLRGFRLTALMTGVECGWGPDYVSAMRNLMECWTPDQDYARERAISGAAPTLSPARSAPRSIGSGQ